MMGQFRLVTLDGDLVEVRRHDRRVLFGTRYSFSGGQGKLERVAKKINDLEDERKEVREELRDVEGRLDDARDRQAADAADQVREIEADVERRGRPSERGGDRAPRIRTR